MKLNLKTIIFRWWTYARAGLVYVSFPISIFDTALLIKLVFPLNLLEIISLGGLSVIFTVIFAGFIHFRKQPFKMDSKISVEGNPYTYMTQPGLSKELQIPTQILVLRTLRKFADKEDQGYYDHFIQVWERIGRGEDIRAIQK